jgi:phosphoglycolate phosphatase-like HAD superfamily hydrolase
MYRNIIFDFDGVIIDSESVKVEAFRHVLSNYPSKLVDRLIEYHLCNGAISRFSKFRYFLEYICSESPADSKVAELSKAFSEFSMKRLCESSLINSEILECIKVAHNCGLRLFIVSGGAHEDLINICSFHGLDKYFIRIQGSPPEKSQSLSQVISEYSIDIGSTVLIGDSMNDFDAAQYCNIDFIGFNNPDLCGIGSGYLDYPKQLQCSNKCGVWLR